MEDHGWYQRIREEEGEWGGKIRGVSEGGGGEENGEGILWGFNG